MNDITSVHAPNLENTLPSNDTHLEDLVVSKD